MSLNFVFSTSLLTAICSFFCSTSWDPSVDIYHGHWFDRTPPSFDEDEYESHPCDVNKTFGVFSDGTVSIGLVVTRILRLRRVYALHLTLFLLTPTLYLLPLMSVSV